MDVFTMVTVIVVVSVTGGVVSNYLKRRHLPKKSDIVRRLERLESDSDSVRLEERIRTLEAIVTDNRDELKRRIENL